MHKRFLFLGLLLITLAYFSFSTKTQAGTSSLWLDPTELSLHNDGDVSTAPNTANNSIDCVKNYYDCVVTSNYGALSTSGYYSPYSSGEFKPLIGYRNPSASLAIPNSDNLISYSTGPVTGLYLSIYKSVANSIYFKYDPGFGYRYHIVRDPDLNLADRSGKQLPIDPSSVGLSSDNKWLVASAPSIGLVRVDMDNMEALPFGPVYNYYIGLSPSPKVAISNDGRYAAVSSVDFSNFDIYDLSTCGSAPDHITQPLSCKFRSLKNYIQPQIPGYTSTRYIRFASDDTLIIYVNYNIGTGNKIARYTVSSGASTPHPLEYLATGESYVSGEGAYNYQAGTDTSDNACHLSLVSYPLLLGKSLDFNSYHSVACSGARIDDITNSSINYTGQVRNKISRDQRDQGTIIANFLPGYIDQLDFISKYQPKVVTLSIGGNDIGFSGIVRQCIAAGTCYSTYEDRLELVREINSQFANLTTTYQKVRNALPPDSKIYIIGYPEIVKSSGDCGDNVRFNSEETVFANQLVDYLDLVIQKAATKVGVGYVDINQALADHRLCETNSENTAINGLTAGNDFPNFLHGPIGNESYHPNQIGHQLIAKAVQDNTANFSRPMPAADDTAAVPSENGLEILKAPKVDRPVNTVAYDDNFSSDVVYRNSDQQLSLDGKQYSISTGTSFKVELHTDKYSLGQFTTDSAGNLSAQISIPNDVPLGYHTLHIYSTRLDGQPVDIYKTVYIASSTNDFDGDNIDNTNDECTTLEGVSGTAPVCLAKAKDQSKEDPPTSSNTGSALSSANSLYSSGVFTLQPSSSALISEPVYFSFFNYADTAVPVQITNRSGKVLGLSTSKISTPKRSNFSKVVFMVVILMLSGGLYWKLRRKPVVRA